MTMALINHVYIGVTRGKSTVRVPEEDYWQMQTDLVVEAIASDDLDPEAVAEDEELWAEYISDVQYKLQDPDWWLYQLRTPITPERTDYA